MEVINMTNFFCCCRNSCAALAVFASLIVGIITAVLRFTAVITLTPAFLWVLFGIAVVYLTILLITSRTRRHSDNYCCPDLSAILAGILGTILTSVILLGVTFVATSILGALITGALLFFFSLTVTSAACLTSCKAGCNNED